jgi:lipoprotein-releasing system ATP-binding protein
VKKALSVDAVWKTFDVGEGTLDALRGVSFEVAPGEILGLVGESGSGKSTLLHILGALDSPTKGAISVGGFNPFSGSDLEVSRFRNRHIGFVFQHNNLLAEFSALENVMMPGLIAGRREGEVRSRALELLERVGMTGRIRHYPGQLSGGEQQRVAIARALINSPLLLLADEPSGNLDSMNAANIHALFLEINRTLGSTMLIVTHNMHFAAALPRVVALQDGAIISDTVCKIPSVGE